MTGEMSSDYYAKINNTFGSIDKIILPVLSYNNSKQFKTNINNLYDYFLKKKINGVWILSSIDITAEIILWAKKKYPDLWIGINLLGYEISVIINFLEKYNPDGLWTDNSYITDKKNQVIPTFIKNEFKRVN